MFCGLEVGIVPPFTWTTKNLSYRRRFSPFLPCFLCKAYSGIFCDLERVIFPFTWTKTCPGNVLCLYRGSFFSLHGQATRQIDEYIHCYSFSFYAKTDSEVTKATRTFYFSCWQRNFFRKTKLGILFGSFRAAYPL